jgi:carbonic anhydrase
MTTSPMERSLAHLRAAGYLAEKVERRNAHTHITNDLYGFIDILAVRPNEILGVQVTSGAHVANRITKIAEHPNTPRLREAGIRLEVHGWRKSAKSGRWELRTVDIS